MKFLEYVRMLMAMRNLPRSGLVQRGHGLRGGCAVGFARWLVSRHVRPCVVRCVLLYRLIQDYARQKVEISDVVGVNRNLMNHRSCSDNGIRDTQPMTEFVRFDKLNGFY